VAVGGADVLAGVLLGVEPADLAGVEVDVDLAVGAVEAAAEGGEVTMTLSGWPWRWVRSPGRSRYSRTRTRSFSKTTR
jgi:hypothetical protein